MSLPPFTPIPATGDTFIGRQGLVRNLCASSVGLILPDTGWHRIAAPLPVHRGGDRMDLSIYGNDLPVGQEPLVDDVSETCV